MIPRKKQACLAYASHLKQRSCMRDMAFTVRVSWSSPKTFGYRMVSGCCRIVWWHNEMELKFSLTPTKGMLWFVIFWNHVWSICECAFGCVYIYILCSYMFGILRYHMFWYCDLLRVHRRTHCQSPKFLKSKVLFWSWNTTWPAGARVGRPTGFRGIQEPAKNNCCEWSNRMQKWCDLTLCCGG